jgi:hypothetical protein
MTKRQKYFALAALAVAVVAAVWFASRANAQEPVEATDGGPTGRSAPRRRTRRSERTPPNTPAWESGSAGWGAW